jgi:hypothetical protein
MKRTVQIFAWIFLAQVALLPAQDFTNLDFEAAQNLPPAGGSVATTDALPGWAAFNSTGQLFQISYNVPDPVELVGSNSPAANVIDGNFSVYLANGGSISQTGYIPSDAQTLYFEAWLNPRGGNILEIDVSIGGQNLSLTSVSQTAPDTYLWAADISAFAGRTAALTFSTIPDFASGDLDDIQFSSQAIPEPSPSWLLFLGSGVFMFLRTRIKSSG